MKHLSLFTITCLITVYCIAQTHKLQKEKIRVSRISETVNDTTRRYTTMIYFANDSVKAVGIEHFSKSLDTDQLELSAGWGGGNMNFAPASGIFFIDKMQIDSSRSLEGEKNIFVFYWVKKETNSVLIKRNEIVHPDSFEKAWATLQRFAKLTP